MANIAIAGAGNVGANAAFFIAEQNVAPVLLYDLQDGLATGKGLDLMEAAPVRDYQHPITSVDSLDALKESALLVVTPGAVPQPVQSEADVAEANAALIDELAAAFRSYEGVVLIATDPVDAMTLRFQRESGIESRRVLGLGGVVDALRLRAILARELGVTAENVSAQVVGPHSSEVLPLFEYSRVSGIAVPMLLGGDDLERIGSELQDSGRTLLDLLQRSAGYYGAAAAIADVARAVLLDTHRILSLSFVLDGQFGLSDVALSLPVVVGRGGIDRVLEPKLSQDQVQRLKAAADQVSALASA